MGSAHLDRRLLVTTKEGDAFDYLVWDLRRADTSGNAPSLLGRIVDPTSDHASDGTLFCSGDLRWLGFLNPHGGAPLVWSIEPGRHDNSDSPSRNPIRWDRPPEGPFRAVGFSPSPSSAAKQMLWFCTDTHLSECRLAPDGSTVSVASRTRLPEFPSSEPSNPWPDPIGGATVQPIETQFFGSKLAAVWHKGGSDLWVFRVKSEPQTEENQPPASYRFTVDPAFGAIRAAQFMIAQPDILCAIFDKGIAILDWRTPEKPRGWRRFLSFCSP